MEPGVKFGGGSVSMDACQNVFSLDDIPAPIEFKLLEGRYMLDKGGGTPRDILDRTVASRVTAGPNSTWSATNLNPGGLPASTFAPAVALGYSGPVPAAIHDEQRGCG
jgi:hypothetical protein